MSLRATEQILLKLSELYLCLSVGLIELCQIVKIMIILKMILKVRRRLKISNFGALADELCWRGCMDLFGFGDGLCYNSYATS